MNVASLELCKTLWEASGWRDTSFWFNLNDRPAEIWEIGESTKLNQPPAYDTGFLLRKLQYTSTNDPSVQDEPHILLEHSGVVKPEYRWGAKLFNGGWYEQSDATPENALAKLAIELFRSGVLKKGIGDE